MRLFLDQHVSGRRVGSALRTAGHDVFAAGEHPSLDGTDDEELLLLATREGRITVTHNVRDFVPILVEWGAREHSHAGCILVKGIDHSQIGVLVRGIVELLDARPSQSEWVDLAIWLSSGDTG